jgi:hypothetical protein
MNIKVKKYLLHIWDILKTIAPVIWFACLIPVIIIQFTELHLFNTTFEKIIFFVFFVIIPLIMLVEHALKIIDKRQKGG